MSFFAELQRRNVVKVAAAYIVASWLLLQLAEVLTELLELSTDVGKMVILLLVIGFVPTVIFAWIFELTPEGIKRESEIDRSQSIAGHTGRKLNRAIIVMLVAVAGYFFWESRFKEPTTVIPEPAAEVVQATAPEPEALPPADQKKSIVVLPFVNMSNDPEQEFFSDGLSEEILNALAKVDELKVISRTSAFAFKNKELSIPQIAEQLDVSHVVEGSVRSAGDSVRITAQLIDVASDSHLWSEAYSRSLEDVFEIQEEISLAIAGQLQVRLTESGERVTRDVEAYQLFLQGRHSYQQRGVDNLDRAIRVLTRATEIDPEFDEAWANLAAASLVRGFGTGDGFRNYYRNADVAADRAIQINPQSGLGLAVQGLRAFSEQKYELALGRLTRAIELNPNESNTYLWRAIVRLSLGYIKLGLEDLQAAEAFDPVFTNLHNWLIQAYVSSGDYERVEYHLNVINQLDPEFGANYFGDAALSRGDLDRAELEVMNSRDRLSEEQVRIFFAALRDPSRTDEAVALLLAGRGDGNDDIFLPLVRLGRVDMAVAAWRELLDSGRGLRAQNGMGVIWSAYDREVLKHPAILQLMEDSGVADYWRVAGDPDYCRRTGDTFECG